MPYVCLLLSFLCLLGTTPAQARSWNIADYASTISIDDHGAALISEQITVNFVGHFNGIYREIPIEYPGPKGANYTLFLDVLRVADDQGVPLKYELSTIHGSRKIKIYIPGAEDTRKTVAITYSVPNAIRYFDEFDEFYWNVTGNDWPVPIDHARAFVTLPPKAAGVGLRAQAFTGMYGSQAQEATSSISESNVAFETTNPLSMRGGMTIDIYIPKGILQKPSAFTQISWFLKSNPILLLPPLTFLVMFGMWYWKGRDPDPGVSVAPMYEPPKDMTPAEVGALVDEQITSRDITSTLVDLAVRGYISITETETQILFFHSKDYILRLLKTSYTGLAAHERIMLENIFQGGADVPGIREIRLSSLHNHFYTVLPLIKQNIQSSLDQKGMYGLDPNQAKAYSVAGILIVAAPFVLLQFFGGANFFLSGWVAGLAILVSAGIALFFAHYMPARSLLGARTWVSILGFEEFMKRVDGDRLRTMPATTFEKFLPYAMALGVEQHWAKAFSGIVQSQPSWYQSSNAMLFNPLLFTHNVRTMTDIASATFVSAPRSSSSGSGFGGGGGGGGFSGGGFGGGGGGSF